MSIYHVFGRRTVAATWAAYSSHATEAEAARAARFHTKAGRVNEAIVIEIIHDFAAVGCSKSFTADELKEARQ